MEEKNRQSIGTGRVYPSYCNPVGIATEVLSLAAHPQGVGRVVGVDLSKQSCSVCILDLNGQVVLHQVFSLRSTAKSSLYEVFQDGDLALMEASTGTFAIAREMNRLPGVVACVVNPHLVANTSKRKTDKEDSLFLARTLLRTPVSELQLVSIPTDEEMDNRAVVSHYRKINEQHTQCVNQLHALFLDKGYPEAGKEHDLHTQKGRTDAIEAYFGSGRAHAAAKGIAKDLGKELLGLEELESKGDRKLAGIVRRNPEMSTILGSIPGVGVKVISAFIAFVGDVDRFSGPKQLAVYCGLVPRVYQSGQKDASGKISKEGQAVLREYLVESVFSMQITKFEFPLKRKYRQLRERMADGRRRWRSRGSWWR
jgi:transposase